MATILLTSTGLSNKMVREEFVKIAKAENKKAVAIITTAGKEKENNKYCQIAFSQFQKIGFTVIDFIDLETEPSKDFSKYDVIYVSGGNTFKLLKFARQVNFKTSIQNLFDRGGIYVGVSAGSYIMCPTIEMTVWKNQDQERHGVDNLTALNFVPFLVTAHFEPKYKDIIKNAITQAKYPVKILTDQQALLIKDSKIKLIGEGKEVKL